MSKEQILYVLRQAEVEERATGMCREMGSGEQMSYAQMH